MEKPPYQFVVVEAVDGGYSLVQHAASMDIAIGIRSRLIRGGDRRELVVSEICQETGRLLAVSA